MSFEVILTSEITDKQSIMAQKIADWLNANPKNQVFFLVPDHIKFSAELEMIRQVGKILFPSQTDYAITRLQIYSFQRLAWYLLRDHPQANQPTLSSVGIKMILQKIMQEHQEEFLLFRQEAKHKGFIEELAKIMHEFQQGGIEVEDFESLFSLSHPTEIEQRLKEFGMIYRYYLAMLSRDFLQKEDLMRLLVDEIKQKKWENTYVIIDQTYALNFVEYEIIEALTVAAQRVEFYTTLTPYALQNSDELEQGLFSSNKQLLLRLFNWLEVDSRQNLISQWSKTNPSYHPDFKILETFWLETSGGLPRRIQQHSSNKQTINGLTWITYQNEQQELEETLAQIKQLVESGKYRYCDIQLLSRNLEEEQVILKPLLEQYGIPSFIDLAETMEQHPLLIVIDSIFKIHQYFWRYSDIMSLLRTEYCFWLQKEEDEQAALQQLNRFRNQVDFAENIILSQGYEGVDWLSKKSWHYVEEIIDEDTSRHPSHLIIEELNEAQQLREKIVDTLEPFFKQLSQAQTTREAMTALYQVLEAMNVPKAMLYWRDHFAKIGNVQSARRQEQVWQEFLNLLDEYVYIFGDDPFDLENFQLVLHTGFEHMHYNLAPPTLDQLTCTGIDSVRFSPKKVTFVIGLSQGSLPKTEENNSLLTDEERNYLTAKLDSGRFLYPTNVQRQSIEPYLFYKLLTSATDYLYLSFSQSTNGNHQQPSAYVQRLLAAFKIEQVDGHARQQERVEEGHFSNTTELFSVLLSKMRFYKTYKAENIPILWTLLPHLLKNDKELKQRYHTLIASVFRLNIATQLPQELALALYGQQLYLSTSQVESFYKDPFSHFLQYGLKLKERREFELTAAGTGEYFHEVADQFIKQLQFFAIPIQEISLEKQHAILQTIFKQLQKDSRFSILQSSPRLKFIEQLLQETITKTIQASLMQLQQLQINPWRSEVIFGKQHAFPIELSIDDTKQVSLRGKIDRIDLLETPSHITMGIVDYKSSAQNFDINRLEAGIQIQLLTYLMVAKQFVEIKKQKPVIPYGGLYLHVFQPHFTIHDIKNMDQWQNEWLKSYRLQGLLTSDVKILQQIEPSFESGQSLYLPFGIKKDGQFTKNSSVITPDELELLMQFAFKQIAEAGRRILNGEIQLAPFEEFRQFSDSVAGKFSAIAQFDATNPENRYRNLTKHTLREGIDHIQQQIGGED